MFEKFPRELSELWAAHEFFRQLGFIPDDIYVHLREDDNMLMCVLQTQNKTFAISMGITALTQEELNSSWGELVDGINSGKVPSQNMRMVWESSFVYKNKVAIIGKVMERFDMRANLDNIREKVQQIQRIQQQKELN